MEISHNLQNGNRSELLRSPDSYCIYLDGKVLKKRPGDPPRDIFVRFEEDAESGGLSVVLHATKAELYHLRLRWNFRSDETLSVPNGFSSVRVYSEPRGDCVCGFRGIEPDRLMPWFFAATSGSDLSDNTKCRITVCYGVTSHTAAHCAWQLDHLGVTLWLDMRSGRMPLVPKSRAIRAATIKRSVFRNISAFDAAKDFCRELFPDRTHQTERILGTRLSPICLDENDDKLQKKVKNNAAALESISELVGKPLSLFLDFSFHVSEASMCRFAESISKHGIIPAIIYHPTESEKVRMIVTESGKRIPDISDLKVTDAICEKIRSIVRMGFRMIALNYDDFNIFGECDSFGQTMHLPDDDGKLIYLHHTSAEIINSFYNKVRSAIDSEEEIFGYKIPLIVFGAVPHLCSSANYMSVTTGDSTLFFKTIYKNISSLISALIHGGHSSGFVSYLPGAVHSSARDISHGALTHLSKSGLSFIISYDAEYASGSQSSDIKKYFINASKPPEVVYPIDLTETILPTIWKRGRKSVTLKLFGRDGYEHFGDWKF